MERVFSGGNSSRRESRDKAGTGPPSGAAFQGSIPVRTLHSGFWFPTFSDSKVFHTTKPFPTPQPLHVDSLIADISHERNQNQ